MRSTFILGSSAEAGSWKTYFTSARKRRSVRGSLRVISHRSPPEKYSILPDVWGKSCTDYLRGQRVRGLIREEMDRVLADVDVLIAPTLPIAAPPVGAREVDIDGRAHPMRASLIRYTRPFNVSGHPAASVPCGFTADGLPIGMQVIGRSFDEATVLRVADAYQRVTDWHTRRPPSLGR